MLALQATEEVQPNEELTIHYGWTFCKPEDKLSYCYCGANNCTGVINMPRRNAKQKEWQMFALAVRRGNQCCFYCCRKTEIETSTDQDLISRLTATAQRSAGNCTTLLIY